LKCSGTIGNKFALIENKWSFSPTKKRLFSKKLLSLYKKRRSNVWKTNRLFKKLKQTNMGKSKWFCPTAKPPSYTILKKISLG